MTSTLIRPEHIPADLWAANLAVEKAIVDQGRAEYYALIKSHQDSKGKSESSTSYGRSLLVKIVEPTYELLKKEMIEAHETGRPGSRRVAVPLIAVIGDLKIAAYMAGKTVVDGIVAGDRSAASVCRTIAERILTEIQLGEFEAAERRYYTAAIDRAARLSQSYDDIRRNMLTKAQKGLGVTLTKWSQADRIQVGAYMLDLLIRATGVVEVVAEFESATKSVNRIHPTPEVAAWLQKAIADMEDRWPSHRPLLCPPKPWTSSLSGGYWSIPQSMVKHTLPAYHEELSLLGKQMQPTYASVNALQDTAWEINSAVLGVAQGLWTTQRYPTNLMPMAEPTAWPDRPQGDDPDTIKAWKVSCAIIGAQRTAEISLRCAHMATMAAAVDYNGKPLWFPYQLDFRGRVYSVSTHISPQGGDLHRGLLQFHQGLPIDTQEQADWLAVHGANSWGHKVDKASYKDRIAWVAANEALILRTAANPHEHRQWMEADAPWQFLAWCFEWSWYLGVGFGFESKLCVALDGTCSGLQHYSAILRDEVGGAETNLVPRDKPADIYAAVATRTLEIVRTLVSPEEPMAQWWLDFGIDRNTAKRPVMTLPYGATAYSARDYIFEWLEGQIKGGRTGGWGKSNYLAANWLAGHLWTAIGETVIAAKAAMDWLRHVAREVAKSGKPVQWTTPSGMWVHQAYPKTEHRRVKTRIAGSLVYISYKEEIDGFDSAKMANSLPPNWIHSMDGSALTLTVVACHKMGIENFGMIHDSFGTHAANIPTMARVLREEFVRMYSDRDVLANLEEEVRAACPGIELEDRPQMGSLDIAGVLSSKYFFA